MDPLITEPAATVDNETCVPDNEEEGEGSAQVSGTAVTGGETGQSQGSALQVQQSKAGHSTTNNSETPTNGDKKEILEEVDEEESRPQEHIVTGRETLTSIAAMYDVTPSELAQKNKLGMSRMVFPGQILRIPPPPPPPPPPPDPVAEIEIIEYQFIKLRVRHITSGRGVVGGSVLFTPNAVIFDPDPKDPLVEELEPEAFQIIAPMEFVVNAAIFLDFFPIGSTGKTVGREHPPSQIFSKPDKSEGRSLQRQDTSESSYSLCQESKKEEAINRNDAEDSSSDVKHSAKVIEEPRMDPYYLRLTMGKPVNREVSRSTPTMAYGMQTMMPEYWFIVPSKQVNNMYNFFQCWFPEIYSPFDLEEIHEMGFELVPEPDLSKSDSVSSINTASKVIHKTMTLNSIDIDFLMPELEIPSELVSDDQRKFLYRHLPPRVQGYKWHLLFSTAKDGFSLHSLYRKSAHVDSPVLMIIQDTNHAVFGALISCPPAQSEKFLGTGESWLFTFFPSFKVYAWTGENNYIMRGGPDNLIVGSSEGMFGLWLDENFNLGRSQAVTTFDNKPLPGKEDFVINNIECWAFVM
eukprot:GFUD01002614.1.p1 GENE.GFUD01002614.1~~GFUD01002614.1.p1  ORF type:complete len:577 (+),score=93.61 GFUD01002614.1:160-1890(+)